MEYNENNEILTIKKVMNSSSIVRFKDPIKGMHPLNSEIDVYYDPENPKLAYVKRYCNKKWMFWAMFVSGIIVLITDVIIILM